MRVSALNTLRQRQNGGHFPDDIFKCIFMNENVWVSIKDSTEVYSQGSSIGSDNSLMLTKRQAIIWTNDGLVWQCIYASLGLNELKVCVCVFFKMNIGNLQFCTIDITCNLMHGILSQHFGCRCPGVSAPGDQQRQCWAKTNKPLVVYTGMWYRPLKT